MNTYSPASTCSGCSAELLWPVHISLWLKFILCKLLNPTCTWITGIRGRVKAGRSVSLGALNPRLQTDPLQETGEFPTADGLHDQILVAVRAAVVAFVRRHQKLSLYWTEPVPAGSKTDPLLPKADPNSDAGGTLLITYFRMGKKWCAGAVRERNKRKVREPTLQMARPLKKWERRCSRQWSRDSSAAHGEDRGDVGGHPAAHGGPHGEAGGCVPK